MSESETTTDKTMWTGLLVIGLAGCVLLAVQTVGAVRETARLREKAHQLRADTAILQAALTDPRLRDQVKDLLPRSALSAVVDDLAAMAASDGIVLSAVDFQGPSLEQGYERQPVVLNFIADFVAAGEFLAALQTYPRALISVEQFRFSVDPRARRLMEARVTLHIYTKAGPGG